MCVGVGVDVGVGAHAYTACLAYVFVFVCKVLQFYTCPKDMEMNLPSGFKIL